jgi:hypothetical protein
VKLICLICFLAFSALAAPERLVVHEWGTFTSLQDETGSTLGSLNSDDEPLPSFTHELDYFHRLKPGELPPLTYQGAPPSHPAVTMRLETPVVYFHPPKSASLPIEADIKVSFYSGWLTQFYPDADAETNGFSSNGRLGTRFMPGWLKWNGLKIGAAGAHGPETTEHVWTAPRAVQAAAVTTRTGQSEKFLFYRGVGQIDAPLRVFRSGLDDIVVQGQLEAGMVTFLPLKVRKLWLAQFRPDGTCAFRALAPIAFESVSDTNRIFQRTPATFLEDEFLSANLKKLQANMRSALIEDGLFADEADALLNTWEVSYFKSWGLRLFFLVPRTWTDYRMPIEISVPSDITRVMVGRIELITAEHRALLRQLAEEPVPDKPWARYDIVGNRRVMKGTMPPVYRDLGRFRNALILDEEARRPTEALKNFIRLNGLQASTRLE